MREIVSSHELLPLVPLTGYSKTPFCQWSKEETWIKDIDGCNIKKFSWINKEGNQKQGQVTGFSLLLGKKSNITVIDLDIGHSDTVNGVESFKELIKDLPKEDIEIINSTFIIQSPRGGYHLYFKYVEGIKGITDYFKGVGKPGIDVRTDGNLVPIPGTKIQLNGQGKALIYSIKNNSEIKPMPQSLITLFKQHQDKPVKKASNTTKISNSKYYKVVNEGEGRDNTLLSWLGSQIKNNPNMRKKENLIPYAFMYNQCYLNPPLETDIVIQKVDSVLKYALPPYCDEKGNVDTWLLVQYVMENNPCYVKGNLWFIYNKQKGCYDFLETEKVQKLFFQYAINSKDKTVNHSLEFAKKIMLTSEDARETFAEKDYINCLNGVIDIKKDSLLPHDPKYKLSVQFKANLIEHDFKTKFNNSHFKSFLEGILDTESIITLQESWGLMLSPHGKEVQNCFIYKGEGSNGKGALEEIQEALLDEKYICSIGLGDFNGDYDISSAEGKHVNIVRDDETEGKMNSKIFKSMVCSEPVKVNRKFANIVRMRFNITHFFGLNRMPYTSDKSKGFFRRPIIIPFNQSFGNEEEVRKGIANKLKDPLISDKIIRNEIDIVFTWAYEGLKRLKKNNWTVTVSNAAKQELENFKEEVDSVYAFYKNCISQSKGNLINATVLYNSYNAFCIKQKIVPVSQTNFGRQIKGYGVKKDNANGNKVYYFDISFKTENTVQEILPKEPVYNGVKACNEVKI
ncbi:DNA primase [Clostridium manihotivorum]|uniref:DNA primase n=1 Tax=Clostridium manihotivorum TaxID=2320868 RepID=A0A3R5U8Z4_9CLOT|nr:DNA primase [Clostridium manihotivorum]